VTPTPDITIAVPGRLRYWVAEALFEAVKIQVALETSQPRDRRRQRLRGAARIPSIADGLRDLAAQISDPAVSVFHLEDEEQRR